MMILVCHQARIAYMHTVHYKRILLSLQIYIYIVKCTVLKIAYLLAHPSRTLSPSDTMILGTIELQWLCNG